MNLKNAAAFAGMAAVMVSAAPTIGATYTVTLEGRSFVYDGQSDMDIALDILVGDTVRWDWVSGFHNVVNGFPGDADEDTIFNSGLPTSDASTVFEYTFNEEGVFGYHCEVHEDLGMVSFVTVTPTPGTLLAVSPLGLMLTRRRR